MLAVLEWPWMGDPMAEPHWELSYPPEYLDDVGVLKPLLTKPLDT
jgi:hypothetical protein